MSCNSITGASLLKIMELLAVCVWGGSLWGLYKGSAFYLNAGSEMHGMKFEETSCVCICNYRGSEGHVGELRNAFCFSVSVSFGERNTW